MGGGDPAFVSFARYKRVFGSTVELTAGLLPTPLVRLPRASRNGLEIWAKLEFYNPFSHSVKDRAAWGMLAGAMKRSGADRFYEATSGNLGVALAAMSASIGVKFRAYVPRNASQAAVKLMRLLGAEVVVCQRDRVDDEMVEAVKGDALSDGAVYLDQYNNEDNPRAQEGMVEELMDQLEAAGVRPKALVASTGSLGHLTALSRLGRRAGYAIVAATPAEGERIPGLRRDWKRSLDVDLLVEVRLKEAASAAALVAREEGLAVGLSSGATLVAVERAAEELGQGAYAMIFADDAMKYLDVYEELGELAPAAVRSLRRQEAEAVADGDESAS